MIEYRSFRNADPPELVRLWNAAVEGRAARPIQVDALESAVFSKLYFDPRGLLLAIESGRPVGFAHGGFGCDQAGDRLDRSLGVVSAVLVHPKHRRHGIGRELVRHVEHYLTQSGAQVIYAGGMNPVNPFYLGVYGGSELPGFLHSSPSAKPFVEACGYRRADECLVLTSSLTTMRDFPDPRFVRIRRTTLFEEDCLPKNTWWWASTMGPFDQRRFRVLSREDGHQLAEATAWDMVYLSRTLGARTAGLVGVEVAEDVRGQGFGKFLVAEVLARLREHYFAAVEVQTMERNQTAIELYRSLGFEEIDRGTIYRKE